jgi:pyrroloquinoline-quinone synthase
MDKMNFAQTLVQSISDKHLLNHVLYQGWNEGSVPIETLRTYAQQYYHHVKAFPRYVSATHSNCADLQSRQVLLDNLIDEEKGSENHPELWLRFAEGIGASRESVESATVMPEIKELVDSFLGAAKRSYAEGLGALFAYEHQIPEIAKFKADALAKHYGVKDAATLSFFNVHSEADVYHTAAITQLLEALSPEEKELAAKATRVTADHLWKFLDGIYKTMSV